MESEDKFQFPQVNKFQVLLMRAETSTGIILDENFKYHIGSRNVYTIFENLEAASEYIKNMAGQLFEVDFTVFNSDGKIILYIQG